MLLVGTLWYLVSIEWYWLIYDGAVSVEGGTGWYLVVLGQYGAELVDTWWCWDSIGQYWLILGGTGTE